MCSVGRQGCAFVCILLLLTGGCVSLQNVEAQETTSDAPAFSEQLSDSSQTTVESEQDQTGASSVSAAGTSTAQVTLPSFSYKDSKESTIGRALVLSIGLFPFSYFYTGIIIGVARYASHGFDAAYAPWSSTASLSNSEMWTKIAVSSAASLVFGLLGAMLK